MFFLFLLGVFGIINVVVGAFGTNVCARVDQLVIFGMVILPLVGNYFHHCIIRNLIRKLISILNGYIFMYRSIYT